MHLFVATAMLISSKAASITFYACILSGMFILNGIPILRTSEAKPLPERDYGLGVSNQDLPPEVRRKQMRVSQII